MIANIQLKNIEQLLAKRNEVQHHMGAIGLADAVVYYYVKEGSLFSKKEQRSFFYFFQGLNTNPQNLSIFLRDQMQRESKQSKQKLVKGIFVIYDIFSKSDCVIEINIPGNLRIYKMNNQKKELISNEEIDLMYISAIMRTMFEKNIVWGKSYNLFRSSKNVLDQYKSFLNVFIKIIQKNDIYISDDFENKSNIKGSHLCSILFEYVKKKRIIHHTIEYLENFIIEAEEGLKSPKITIFLAQLYCEDEKYNKSLSIVAEMLKKYVNDPFLLYYQAKYMLKLMAIRQALTIVNSIVQYNHYQIWILAANLHVELKNYSEVVVCLNHASKLTGKQYKKNEKAIELCYKEFESLGKVKNSSSVSNEIQIYPKLMVVSENPTSLVSLAEQKLKSYLDREYWKMNSGQRVIYDMLRILRYRLEVKKFQQLLQNTFEESKKAYEHVNFRNGMTESMFVEMKKESVDVMMENTKSNLKVEKEDLPGFLQDQSMQVDQSEIVAGNRNLSIIQEIQSVIENSQYEQTQTENHNSKRVKCKKQMTEQMYKILRNVLGETELQKAEYEDNYAKLLPVYNKLRTLSRNNNFHTNKMFQILVKTANYKSIIVLIAETLDFLEQKGVRKIEIIPFWIEKYLFTIIQEKGLKFLNDLLGKLDFLDQAIVDCIQLAKQWKVKGCTF